MNWLMLVCARLLHGQNCDSTCGGGRGAEKRRFRQAAGSAAAALLLALIGIFAPRAAEAQIGVGFVDTGWYQGTIGTNKGGTEGYRCPDGGVLRGIYHIDKQVPYPPMSSAAGMTAQGSIYCSLVMLDVRNNIRVYPKTPNGTPTVSGYLYNGADLSEDDSIRSAYCPIDQIVTRMDGTQRVSSDQYPPWSSSFAISCRPMQLIPGDWVVINNAEPSPTYLAGRIEDELWPHNYVGWICPEGANVAVNGIYRQGGGEGYDGVNIFCAYVRQARLSARLEFRNFNWQKTLGPDGWLVDLTQNKKVLESSVLDPDTGATVIISGHNKLPYSSFVGTENDLEKFQYEHELYVLPNAGYGASLSHTPEIPDYTYTATSTCLSTIAVQDHQDNTCDLIVVGRPDIGVEIATPEEGFVGIGTTKNITIKAENSGSGAAGGQAGFTLETVIPRGWTAQAVPGCTVSGQNVSCAITQDLAETSAFRDDGEGANANKGGSVSFTFPITANADAQPGAFDVPLKLGRTAPDGSGLPENSDYNVKNDTSLGQIRFSRNPSLNITKISLDGTGSFTFSGNNGWKEEALATQTEGAGITGSEQILSAAQRRTRIRETSPASGANEPVYSWIMNDGTVEGAASACTIADLGAADKTPKDAGEHIIIDKAAQTILLDETATDFNKAAHCTIYNQLATTRTVKTSDKGNNAPVQSGDEIIYKLSTQVIGADTSRATVLTDNLGDSLEFVEMVDAGEFSAYVFGAPQLIFTLPRGSEKGKTYELSYKARVKKNAKGAVKNVVVSDNGYCDACETNNPLVQISTVKSSDVGTGNNVAAGDIITYSLVTNIEGGVTESPFTLTDKLSDNMEFAGIDSAGAFTVNASDPKNLVFTLPKGTAAGLYEVKYKAKIKADATGSVSNEVTASAGACEPCATANPLASVRIVKSSDISDSAAVQNGSIITYKLHVIVAGGYSTQDTVLTDTLSNGLEFQSVADAGRFSTDVSAAPKLIFTLAKGTPAGEYDISYKAKVKSDAKGEVRNNVIAENAFCDVCATKNPITDISSDKISDPASGAPVSSGAIIRYTLTVHIKGGSSADAVTLTDTLGAGLDFDSVENQGAFTADTGNAPILAFTLPKNTPAGDYPITYRVKVRDDASADLVNNVVPSAGTCASCSTRHPLVSVSTAKTADRADGAPLQKGDIITYTLTSAISGGASAQPLVLTDTLGAGLEFAGIADAGQFNADTAAAPRLTFTLPSGKAAGTYKISYRARVLDNAGAFVANRAAANMGTCSPCAVQNPITAIATKKEVNIGQAGVEPSDIVIYTLTSAISGGKLSKPLVLTDNLSDNLEFIGLSGSSPFQLDAGNAQQPKFTLPAGTEAGTYKVSYQARVKDGAADLIHNKVTADNGSCAECETSNPLIRYTIAKTAAGGAKTVSVGDIITYTVEATVKGGVSTQDLVLTDNLGQGLEFVGVDNAGQFTVKEDKTAPQFTLPAGRPAGAYSISYRARVLDNASGAVKNKITPNKGVCETCETENPLLQIATAKTSAPKSGAHVQQGDIITYTLTSTISGGAANQPLVLTDRLADSLVFEAIAQNDGGFILDRSQAPILRFTLPAGALAGAHSVSYTARVKQDATLAAGNKVSPSIGSCENCETNNPLASVSTAKTSDKAGKAVQTGDIITYTLTTTVGSGATTQDTILTDNLGPGLEFAGLGANDGFTAKTDRNPLQFTLPKGAEPKNYSVSYRVKVINAGTAPLVNNVTANNGACSPCSTQSPPLSISTSKSVNIGSGTAVSRGDTLEYTVSVAVAGGATTQDLNLADTLSAGLKFGSVIRNTDGFRAQTGQNPLRFTLPAGADIGTHSLTYTVTVEQNAAVSADNKIVPDYGDCANCETKNPLVQANINKTVSPTGPVQTGDILTYTLTANIEGGAAAKDLVLTDNLGEGLSFVSADQTSRFNIDASQAPNLVFTLPAGTAAGSYSVSYRARLQDGATGSAKNRVTPNYGDCAACATENPQVKLSSSKSSDFDGKSAAIGDIITYQVAVHVEGGATARPTHYNDRLGASLEFVSAEPSAAFRDFRSNPPMLSFTLPAQTPAGDYTISYKARVRDNATLPAQNSLTADYGTCDPCQVTVPLVDIITSKSASPAGAVQSGDIITYTLSADVRGGQTAQPLVLTDTLGAGLDFGQITANDGFGMSGAAPNLVFTLPAGKNAGTYRVSYTATVKQNAATGIDNKVAPNYGSCGICEVSNPPVSMATHKSSTPPSGSSVQPGDIITYTLTAEIKGGATTQDLTLSDRLGQDLQFASVVNAGAFTPNIGDPQNPSFILPKGAAAGTYTATYQARVKADAAGNAITNAVTADKGSCEDCATKHSQVKISSSKTASPASGAAVQKGSIITYTLTTAIQDGVSSRPVVLTDALGKGLKFVRVTDRGQFNANVSNPQALAFTLPAGKAAGSYSVSFTAEVTEDAMTSADNILSVDSGLCQACRTSHPISRVTLRKTSNPASGLAVQRGQTLTYTLSFIVSGGATDQDVIMQDEMPSSLDFVRVTDSAPQITANPPQGALHSFTLAKGAPAGTYNIVYEARIRQDAPENQPIRNNIHADNADCATSDGCATSNPLTGVNSAKTAAPPSGAAVQAGSVITYTITTNVIGGALAQNYELTDILGDSLENLQITGQSPEFTVNQTDRQRPIFTLPAGTPAGAYTITYTAQVSESAKISAQNKISPNYGQCSPCETKHPLIGFSTAKTVAGGSGAAVSKGDILTYTLTATVSGGETAQPLVLTDSMSDGLAFQAVAPGSPFAATSTSDPKNLVFTLPAGKSAGAYSVSYTAKVLENAVKSVDNKVTPSAGTCDNCATDNPLIDIASKKEARPPNGASVQAGDAVIYTLTTEVKGGATTQDTILTDDLGDNLRFDAVMATNGFRADTGNPQKPIFTLPKGAPAGAYSITYRAYVREGAAGSVKNAVTANNGACDPCAVINPQISLATVKTSEPPSGAPVQAGDIITYTLTTTATGATARDVKLTDNLNPSIEFINVVPGSDFRADTASAPLLSFTLPSGAASGAHSVSYRARVKQAASFDARNSVNADTGTCQDCQIFNPLVKVSVDKTATPPAGSSVQRGDIITYRLNVRVEGGATTQNTALTDSLADSLSFDALGAHDGFTAETGNPQAMRFTLPAGAAAGAYSVSYTAKVKDNAVLDADNQLTAEPTDKTTNQPIEDGNIPCDPCATHNPLAKVSTVKTADKGANAVSSGDIIIYTLTTTVAGGALSQDAVLTDNLGAGLDFAAITQNSAFLTDIGAAKERKLIFTLPAGTPAGTYAISYSARVNDTAQGSVKNAVTAAGSECADCSAENPLTDISTEKTVSPAGAVREGDILTYTLSTTIKGGANTRPIILTDDMGDGQELTGAPTGDFSADTAAAPRLIFTLPAGKAAGTYKAVYQARVTADAAGSVKNSVSPNIGSCANCATQSPLTGLSTAKTVSPAGAVSAGDMLTYTLTTKITGGALSRDMNLTDSPSAGLTNIAVKDAGNFKADISNPQMLKFTLPQGTPAGAYSVSYTAIVGQNAPAQLSNNVKADSGSCESCTVTNPLTGISAAKSSDIGAGAPAQAGDIITYSLTVAVKGGASTQATLLTDSLSDSLEFVSVVSQGEFTNLQTSDPKALQFTLPAGKAEGTYAISYRARVKADATTAAKNAVIAKPLDKDGQPIPGVDLPCDPCSTENPLANVATEKTAQPDGAVQAGDIITYTLTTRVSGGALTYPVNLTDRLSANMDFIGITDKGAFSFNNDRANPVFTLPAGTAAGAYKITYQAKLKDNATGPALNTVIADNGACESCSTQNPLIGISAAKNSDIGAGAAVARGDIITYTLTVSVKGGANTQPTLLTDSLSDSLEFVSVVSQGEFTNLQTSDPKALQFTLPAGKAEGTYAISYRARVKIDAGIAAKNAVIAKPLDKDGKPIQGVDLPCDPCTTENPLTGISAAKSSDIGAGAPAQAGDIITYSLTVSVKGGASTQATLLTDSLSDSLEFVSVVSQGEFTNLQTSDPKALQFTLPAGKAEGTYAISYRARVKADATTAAKNAVIAKPLDKDGKPIQGVDLPCDPCATENPLSSAAAAKTSDIGDKKAVQQGDIITYTLTVRISGSAAAKAILLTDSPSGNLDFVDIKDKGAFSADTSNPQSLKFTLPAGTPAGAYSVSYRARVKADATASVNNALTAQPVDKDGAPIPGMDFPCAPCATENPLVGISAAKSSDIGAGKAVARGDIITYSLTVAVKGGASTQATLLTDTLSDSLEFVDFGDISGFTADKTALPQLSFLLPAGQAEGTYTASYRARVKANATTAAQNKLIARLADKDGKPINDPNAPIIPCVPCETQNPLVGIAVSKTANIGTGAAVSKGDVLTYTLSANVSGGQTTQATLLTDTLGEALEFVAITDKGDFTADTAALPQLKFLLPIGAQTGEHKISYQARVKADATTAAQNKLIARPADKDGKPIDDPNAPIIPCAPCETQNPLIGVATAKSSDIGSGNPVQAGQIITYRLTTSLTGGEGTQPVILTDKLGDNLEFIGVQNAGAFTANVSQAPLLSFTLPAGKPAGTYDITYQARVKSAGTGSAQNNVTANQGPCDPCGTQNPLVNIATVKSSDAGQDKPVQKGDIITYSLTTTVRDGVTTKDTHLTDTLSDGLQFGGIVKAGAFSPDISGAGQNKLVFTLPAGQAPGAYTVIYTAIVKDAAKDKIANKVIADNGLCESCETQNPLIGVKTWKSSDIGDGKSVQIGSLITYQLAAEITGGVNTQNILLTDNLGESIDFVSIKDRGAFTPIGSEAKRLQFLLPAGQAPGIYTVSYTARVRADATAAAENKITAQAADRTGKPIEGPDAPIIPCGPCATKNPLSGVYISKMSDIGDKTPVQRGGLITYTLNASVSGGALPDAVLLTDRLNDSLEFVKITDSGAFKADTAQAPVLKFTLPKGTPPSKETYAVSYQARVKQGAQADAQNSVKAQPVDDSGAPIDDPNAPIIPCSPCETQNPLSGINIAKSSDIGAGKTVQRGDIITYQIDVAIDGGATAKNILLTDTMNDSLEFIGQTVCKAAPAYNADSNLRLAAQPGAGGRIFTATIPAGTPAGKSAICYQARVLQTASTAAQNNVKPQYADYQGKPIDDPNLPAIPCNPCSTQNPLAEVKISKSSDIGDKTPVGPGDLITYTIKLEVGKGATTQAIKFTDTLSDTLEFEKISADGNGISFDADSKAPVLKFTAYPGLQPKGDVSDGVYAISYQARVKQGAAGFADNQLSAKSQILDKDGRPVPDQELVPLPCSACATRNPIEKNILIEKKLIAEDGLEAGLAEPQEILTYQITLTNRGGAAADYAAQDILDNNVAFMEADNGGVHNGAASGGIIEWSGLTVPARQNGLDGKLNLLVKTKVNAPIDDKASSVLNFAKEKGAPDPDCAHGAAQASASAQDSASRQCAALPLGKPKLSLKKTAEFKDMDGNQAANAGDVLHYTFTLTNEGNLPLENIRIDDKGPSFDNLAATGRLSAFTPEQVDIAAGGTATITADYILSEADVANSGGRTDAAVNKAIAKGQVKTSGSGGGDIPDLAVSTPEDIAKLTLAAPKSAVSISKTVEIRAIRRGEQAPYTIRVSNNSSQAAQNMRVVDRAPSGFRFVDGSASLDGKEVKPELRGRDVIFTNISLDPGQAAVIRLNMLALSSATPGKYTNRAHAEDAQGNRLTDDAKATVEILVEHVFDCSDVIGTVFDDYNRNGYQDEGEQGLPGVRLATAKGWIITTDTFGRFHIPCAALPDSRIGSNFILKLDARSLPSGYRLTTENPRVVRLTAGKLTKINFGASVSRVVRLDLRNEAFEPGQTALKTEWSSGVAELIQVLDKEQSVLRLSYIDERASAKLAQARIKYVQALIRKIWGSKAGRYRLEIETRVEAGG